MKLTYLPMVTRATVDALREFPLVNSRRATATDIVTPRFVNMGIAVSYDAGLIVPVIKGVDAMNTVGIARAIADLATRARAHQLQPDEVQGATFTITNPGPYGSLVSVPIINQPNAGILSLDAIQKRPVVVEERRDRRAAHGLHLDVVGPPTDRRRARHPVPRAGEAQPRDPGTSPRTSGCDRRSSRLAADAGRARCRTTARTRRCTPSRNAGSPTRSPTR